MKTTKKNTVKRTTARKPAVKRTPAKRPVSRTTTKRKTAPKKVVRNTPTKRTVAKKTKPATRKPVKKTTVKKTVAKRNSARAGEFWTVNDAKTRGHKALLTKRTKKGVVYHIPTTHSPQTRKMKNIPLRKNPQKNKKEKAYVLPKLQKTRVKHLGKKQSNMKIRNKHDKAVVRKIKKQKIK